MSPELPAVPDPPDPWPGTLELTDRLLQRRIVLVAGPLDHDTGTRTAALLMLLDADSGHPVQLHLTCPDGDLDAALALADTLDLMRAPVTALARGTVGGAAVGVLAAADRRLAHPHCTFVLREPHSCAVGRADELAIAAEQHALRVRELCQRVADASGRGIDVVAADLREGRVLTAGKALEYGLVQDLAAGTT